MKDTTTMIRFTSFAAALAFATPAFAIDFEPNDQGQVEFTMPSSNVGCVYTPVGGIGTYYPMGGGPELSCDRVEPSYVRVILGPRGPAMRYNQVGDASCCGAENMFPYGETLELGPFSCLSAASGLTCTRGHHGFAISRRSIRIY